MQYKDDNIEIDDKKPCRVYFNLHKRLFSVTQKNERNNWAVVGHTNYIELKNVKFIVSEAGRQRVLREKRKNVHAFLEGLCFNGLANGFRPRRITYNPYKDRTFVQLFGEARVPIRRAWIIDMDSKRSPKVMGHGIS